jgi:hypothetical protein
LSRHMLCGFRALGRGRSMGMLSSVSRAILKSLRFAPSTARPTGTPDASVSRLRLVPFLARSVGLGPVFFPAERRLRHRSVHRQPVPVEAYELVVGEQPTAPKLLEDSRFGPLQESAMGRRVTADPRRIECSPLAPGSQDEEDGIHRRTVGNTRVVTPERMRLSRGQQRLHLGPEGVRESPGIVLDSFHARRAAAPRESSQVSSPGDPQLPD